MSKEGLISPKVDLDFLSWTVMTKEVSDWKSRFSRNAEMIVNEHAKLEVKNA